MAVLWVLLAVVMWLVVASCVFLWLENLWDNPAIPAWSRPWQWLVYARRWDSRSWEECAYLIFGAMAGAVPGAMYARFVTFAGIGGSGTRRFGNGREPIEHGVTDNHGHASWMPLDEARRKFDGSVGMVVGEANQPSLQRDGTFSARDRSTWGPGGTGQLLIDPCHDDSPTHGMEFCGPGGFKTSAAVTRLLHWPGSAVVLDVANELGPMLARDRQEHGQRVVFLGFGPGDDGLDALSWIDPEQPGAVRRVLSMTASICGEEPDRAKDEIFDSAGRNIVACLLADLIWSDLPRDMVNVISLTMGLTVSQAVMRMLLVGIRERSNSGFARHLAGTLMGLPDETFGGAYFNATTLCSWLFDEDNAELLSGTVQASDLLAGGITVFVQTPLDALTHTPGLGRVIIDAFVSAAIQADGHFQQRMLFLLDEAFRLGPMKSLEVARDFGRKFGITLSMLYQSDGQLLEQWGRHAHSKWFETVSWRSYSSIKDLETAKAISAAVGTHAVLAYSEGDNRGQSKPWGIALGSRSKGSTINVHEISRPLIRPEEVLHDMRRDEQIVFSGFGRPLRCGKAIWWRRSDLLARVDNNRFTKLAAE